jgi:hypothetical protein
MLSPVASLTYTYRYEASASGYDATEKKTELFDLASRFIVLRSQTTSLPFAFAIFRFDTEEGEGDDIDEVLYWCVSCPLDDVDRSLTPNLQLRSTS